MNVYVQKLNNSQPSQYNMMKRQGFYKYSSRHVIKLDTETCHELTTDQPHCFFTILCM